MWQTIKQITLLIALACLMISCFSESEAPKINATIAEPDIFFINQDNEFTLQLTHEDGNPVAIDELVTIHTAKIHLLIIDTTLTDFHHKHPAETNTPGEYTFTFSPQTANPYRIWIDIVTEADKQHHYIPIDINGTFVPDVMRQSKLTDQQQGLNYTLSFDQVPLIIDQPTIAQLLITDHNDEIVTNLEPLLGAYSHIIGFYADGENIIHIHPIGTKPTSEDELATGIILFPFKPTHGGHIKLFSQIKINGKEQFANFSVNILGLKQVAH